MAVHQPADTDPHSAVQRRRLWWIVGAGLLVLFVVILLVANGWASQRADSADAAAKQSVTSPSPPTMPSATPPTTPSATLSATPNATPSSTPGPTPAEVLLPAPSAADPNAGIGVPSGDVAPPQVMPPVPLAEPAEVVPGVVFSISDLEAVDGTARGPGEVAGPSLRFAVSVRNDTSVVVSLSSTVVNFYFGADQTPATELAAPGGVALPDEIAAGGTARGVFVFNVPDDGRDLVQIAVDYSAGVPIVLFEGPAPH